MASQSDVPIPVPLRKRPIEDHSNSPPKKRPALSPTLDKAEDKPCDRCNNISWSQLKKETPQSRYGKIITTLSTSQASLLNSQCPICQLLGSIKPPSLDSETCQLKAFSSRLSMGYNRPKQGGSSLLPKGSVPECTVLYIVPKAEGTKDYIARRGWHQSGCLGLRNSEGRNFQCGPREILPLSINYAVIKKWMDLCFESYKHRGCSAPLVERLQGLKVIDCQMKSVAKAPPMCRYVTLSYVWGLQPSVESTEFPPVVADSISVTLSLGFQYLWVDKYCIDQKDPNKQDQLDNMDRIYSQSELTLVAAAGTDDRYGLPGVGKRARKPQETATIGPVKLIQIPPHTCSTLRSSKWASRGWTYQEGVLSRRLLIFTDDQVSYLCKTMYCAETVDMQPEIHGDEKGKDNPFFGFLPGAVSSNVSKWDKYQYRDLKTHIMEFSQRELSKDLDALNAILGIFKHFQLQGSKQSMLKHLDGMPINLALMSSKLSVPLRWYHNKPATRRDNFPSWSWTGWKGAVSMSDPDVQVSGDCTIEVPDKSDGTTSLFEFTNLASSSGSRSNSPSVLLITAKVIDITLRSKTWDKLNDSFSQESQKGTVRFLNGFHAVLPITEDVSALVYAYLDQEKFPVDGLLGVILGKETSQTGAGILLLEPQGDYYQRVGILRYRHGRGTEAGGEYIPQIIYVDAEENVLEDEIEGLGTCPLWLQGAKVRTVGVA